MSTAAHKADPIGEPRFRDGLAPFCSSNSTAGEYLDLRISRIENDLVATIFRGQNIKYRGNPCVFGDFLHMELSF